MKKNKVILEKVPVGQLLSVLEYIYNNGADFVDIIGKMNPEGVQDEIIFAVQEDYMSDNVESEEEIFKHEIKMASENEGEYVYCGPEKITEEYISDLLEF